MLNKEGPAVKGEAAPSPGVRRSRPPGPARRQADVALEGHAECDPAGASSMRVLVAFGDEYRSYREAIARATIRALRPATQVTVVPLEAVSAQVYRLEPHVVNYDRRSDGVPDRNTTWVTAPTEAGVPVSISQNGSFREVGNLSLTELITMLDEVEASRPTHRDGSAPS